MVNFKNSNSLASIFPSGNFIAAKRKYLYWFCAFGLLMATLEFGQDYISHILNGNYFRLGESLSYKLYWLLFAPSLMALFYLLEKGRARFGYAIYFACNAALIAVLTLVHLVLFALLLFTMLNTVSEGVWSLSSLITEKLSTRLYLGLSVYIGFSLINFWLNELEQGSKSDDRKASQNIKVKNGQHTTLVDIDSINWISSDGAYLNIHTVNKKHVILDSLKNIITMLPENFKRIHRSTIANIDRVKELESRGNGDYDIIMDDGNVLRLSRNYAKPLKGLLL